MPVASLKPLKLCPASVDVEPLTTHLQLFSSHLESLELSRKPALQTPHIEAPLLVQFMPDFGVPFSHLQLYALHSDDAVAPVPDVVLPLPQLMQLDAPEPDWGMEPYTPFVYCHACRLFTGPVVG